jgi:hypothetical protein
LWWQETFLPVLMKNFWLLRQVRVGLASPSQEDYLRNPNSDAKTPVILSGDLCG